MIAPGYLVDGVPSYGRPESPPYRSIALLSAAGFVAGLLTIAFGMFYRPAAVQAVRTALRAGTGASGHMKSIIDEAKSKNQVKKS
jgi:hypothetical protein